LFPSRYLSKPEVGAKVVVQEEVGGAGREELLLVLVVQQARHLPGGVAEEEAAGARPGVGLMPMALHCILQCPPPHLLE